MRGFRLKLDRVLTTALEDISKLDQPTDQGKTSDGLPKGMADQAKNAAALGQAAAVSQTQSGSMTKPNTPMTPGMDNKNVQTPANPQSQQINQQMADLDKKIAVLQTKMAGGSMKPNDMAVLNQLLTAKKTMQDQFTKSVGVNPSL